MSSTQYIKFFNDTVLKQSILQGYEYERSNANNTNVNLGNFTMGELAFTRDTGRVFVGTCSDFKTDKDLMDYSGGILVGNRYYGILEQSETGQNESNECKTTYVPKFNSITKRYDGDYAFDKEQCELIIFDQSIKKLSNSGTESKIYKDGESINIPIYVPDGVSIVSEIQDGNGVAKDDNSNNKNNLNVLSVPVSFIESTLDTKYGIISDNGQCSLPSSVDFGGIKIKFDKSKLTKKGDYVIGYDTSTNEGTLKISSDKISIKSSDDIVVEELTDDKGVTTYTLSLNNAQNTQQTSAIDFSDDLQDLYTGGIKYSSLNYLKKAEPLQLSNNTIDKTIEELGCIPNHANSIILQITTSKNNITRIRHIKSTGVLLSQVQATEEQQIYSIEVPFIAESVSQNGEPQSKRLSIHATGSPTIKVLGYRA